MSALVPRYYQADAHDAVYAYFREGNTGNPLVAMPTGTGKALVIAMLMISALHGWPGTRIVSLTHVRELIRQNLKTLLRQWPTAPAGVYSAGLKRRDHGYPITFGQIQSVYRKARMFGHVDIIVIDEAHLVSPKQETMYRALLDALKKINPALKVIGLSATCYRQGLGLLTNGGIFTDICYDLTTMKAFMRLIAEGYMAPLVAKKPDFEFDLSDVRVVAGEFHEGDVERVMNVDANTLKALTEAMAVARAEGRRRILIFAAGIEHCERVAVLLLKHFGFECVVVHSKLEPGVREQNIERFQSGDAWIAVNNNVLTTGFDCPEIDYIIVLRPTMSTVLHVQMLGRGTRTAELKVNCRVGDFVGNVRRLGPINDPVIPKPPGKKKGGQAPVKICEVCNTYNHCSARECECCKAPFYIAPKIKGTAGTEAPMKLDADFPVVETIPVSHVVYQPHAKKNRPTSMRVSYWCGLRRFTEYVCFAHGGAAGDAAVNWWRSHGEGEIPMTAEEALARQTEIRRPRAVRVWVNKPHPEVMGHVF